MKIFMIAGEGSGDALGAPLMKALKGKLAVPPVITGVGGSLMQKEGLQSLYPMQDLCVMGIVEVLKHAPRLLKLVKEIAFEIERQQPDILITIDLPDFNFRVAKFLKKRGLSKIKIVHYVAPTVWAWRPGRAKKVAQFLDGLICLFPFEPPYFTVHNLSAEFCGHPLVENAPRGDGKAFRKNHEISEDIKTLGLFFGSRHGEFQAVRDIFIDTVKILQVQHENLHLIVPTLPHLESDVRHALSMLDCPATVISDSQQKWQSFAAMDAALAISGTVGLELAYARVPHVIAYRANVVSGWIFQAIAHVQYVHFVNIIARRMIVPEYLQVHCNAPEISQGLLKLLDSKTAHAMQIAEFKDIAAMLGSKNTNPPSSRAADFVLKILKKA
ncbi:MAG: lipid-A-disaccharide synthase [Alphaproteobacteria bacterium]